MNTWKTSVRPISFQRYGYRMKSTPVSLVTKLILLILQFMVFCFCLSDFDCTHLNRENGSKCYFTKITPWAQINFWRHIFNSMPQVKMKSGVCLAIYNYIVQSQMTAGWIQMLIFPRLKQKVQHQWQRALGILSKREDCYLSIFWQIRMTSTQHFLVMISSYQFSTVRRS